MYVGKLECYNEIIQLILGEAFEDGLLSYCRNASKRHFDRAFWAALDEVFRSVVRSVSTNLRHA
jgi:hypothetical protein